MGIEMENQEAALTCCMRPISLLLLTLASQTSVWRPGVRLCSATPLLGGPGQGSSCSGRRHSPSRGVAAGLQAQS